MNRRKKQKKQPVQVPENDPNVLPDAEIHDFNQNSQELKSKIDINKSAKRYKKKGERVKKIKAPLQISENFERAPVNIAQNLR